MQPRKNEKRTPKSSQVRQEAPKPKLRIVKLEPRIAPAAGCPDALVCGRTNHNETLVRESAKVESKAAEPHKSEQKPRRFRIIKLEERIAPSGGLQKQADDVVRGIQAKIG